MARARPKPDERSATPKPRRPRARKRESSEGPVPPIAKALGRVEEHKAAIHRREREVRVCIEEFCAAGGARIAGFRDDGELWERLLRDRPHLHALLGASPSRGRTSGVRFARAPVSERMAVLSRVVGYIAEGEAVIDRHAHAIDSELEAIERSGAYRDLLYRDFEELIERVLGPDPILAVLVSVGARHRRSTRPPVSTTMLRSAPRALSAPPVSGPAPSFPAPSEAPPPFFSSTPVESAPRPLLPSDPPSHGSIDDDTPIAGDVALDIAPDFSVHTSAPPDFLLHALALAGPGEDALHPEEEHPEFFSSAPDYGEHEEPGHSGEADVPAFLAQVEPAKEEPAHEPHEDEDALAVVPPAPLVSLRPTLSPLALQLIVTALALAIGAALGWTSVFTHPPPTHEAAP